MSPNTPWNHVRYKRVTNENYVNVVCLLLVGGPGVKRCCCVSANNSFITKLTTVITSRSLTKPYDVEGRCYMTILFLSAYVDTASSAKLYESGLSTSGRGSRRVPVLL